MQHPSIHQLLGLLVVLTATAAFLASKQLFTADSEAQALQDSARFAPYIVKTIVQQAGYADYTPDVVGADGTVSIVSSLTVPAGGAADPYALDLVGAVNVTKADVGTGKGYGTNDSNTAANASDSLLVRFFGRGNWEAGKGGEADGTIINCVGIPEAPPASPSLDNRGWSFFFVGAGQAGEPELYCKYRDASTGTFKTEPLARGVEVFKIVFGYDTDNDSTPNKWLNAKQVAAQTLEAGVDACMPSSCTDNDKWRKIVAVRIGMVLRGGKANTTQNQISLLYPLGDEFSSVRFAPPDDGRLRRVVTFTVTLRNVLRPPV